MGFGVGMAAGYLADKGLRFAGVDKWIAKEVTATIDGATHLAGQVAHEVKREYAVVVEKGTEAAHAIEREATVLAGKIERKVEAGLSAAADAGNRAVREVKNELAVARKQMNSMAARTLHAVFGW